MSATFWMQPQSAGLPARPAFMQALLTGPAETLVASVIAPANAQIPSVVLKVIALPFALRPASDAPDLPRYLSRILAEIQKAGNETGRFPPIT
ncbi:MAG: hypothetical protein IE919_04040 [Thioclava sp.]|nr:hypothetical protein [Thioclava sp.]MBD3802397.1 hypothetical protein [Thioclava sp.]